jgi:hypothetical protein
MDAPGETAAARRQRSRDVGEYIREEPLTSLAIATAAGFVLGGGVNSRLGLTILTFVCRIALRDVVTGLIVELVTPSRDNGRIDKAGPQ